MDKYIYENINYIINEYTKYYIPICFTKHSTLVEVKSGFDYDYYKNKSFFNKNYSYYTIETIIAYISDNLKLIYGFKISDNMYYINEYLKLEKWKDYE